MGSGSGFVERFWSKVDVRGDDDCWPWTRRLSEAGYGEFKSRGDRHLAHRIAYELTTACSAEGWFVLHSCDNPVCCNPRHLRLGTHADNMQDMHSRGRCTPFKGNRPKLSDEAVRAIRAASASAVALAREFSVSPRTIRDVRNRLVYARVA